MTDFMFEWYKNLKRLDYNEMTSEGKNYLLKELTELIACEVMHRVSLLEDKDIDVKDCEKKQLVRKHLEARIMGDTVVPILNMLNKIFTTNKTNNKVCERLISTDILCSFILTLGFSLLVFFSYKFL